MRPVAHSGELSVRKLPESFILSHDEQDKDFTEDGSSDIKFDPNFEYLCLSPKQHLLTQGILMTLYKIRVYRKWQTFQAYD